MEERRFLLVDEGVIEEAKGVRLRVGEARKDRNNPLFGEELPWEPRFDNLYPNVIRDGGVLRCWYSPFTIDPGSAKIPPEQRRRVGYPAGRMGEREMGVCYAESTDGVEWTKPRLDLVRWKGRKSNLLVRGPHGAGVFKDGRDPDAERRYKMSFRGEEGMAAAFSADGLRWGEPVGLPDLDVPGDTHNNAFWAPTLGKYVCITRMTERRAKGKVRAVRLVARSESDDFVRWTKPEVVFRGEADHLQIYSMPVFFYAGIYLGLPAIFDVRSDRVQTELAWSADAVRWHRVEPGAPLIGHGRRKGMFDWGCVYAAAYPVFDRDRIRLYYGGGDDTHMSWRKTHLALAALRQDGFAGYEPARRRGTVTTRPLAWNGEEIRVTADVRRGGGAHVEAVDARGNVRGCSMLVRRTMSDGVLSWEAGDTMKGGKIRLRFHLDNARLYSFCLSNPG